MVKSSCITEHGTSKICKELKQPTTLPETEKHRLENSVEENDEAYLDVHAKPTIRMG